MDLFSKKEIKFTGKEYLELKKYEDRQKALKRQGLKKLTKFDKILFLIGFISFLLLLITIYIFDNSRVVVHNPISWDQIGKFLFISVGIAWIVHGFGFILIRR